MNCIAELILIMPSEKLPENAYFLKFSLIYILGYVNLGI